MNVMLLHEIVQHMKFETIQGDLNIPIESVAFNSKELKENGLFIAIIGMTTDGHRYIEEAIKQGATAIIVEKDVKVSHSNITILKVQDTRQALAEVAVAFYGHPTDTLHVIGITGTNGKTSTSHFIKSIYEEAQVDMGVIGTMGTFIQDQRIENKNTTPESLDLQRLFNQMLAHGVTHCMMEVSSHALELKRADGTQFHTGIFTNLTPDHLELHKTMENYFSAKAKLFQMTDQFNVINIDDPYGKRLYEMAAEYKAKRVSYGIYEQADIYPTNISYSFNKTVYTVNTPTGQAEITVHLPGDIYVYNSLAAIACAYSNGISLEQIQRGIQAVAGIRGRMEVAYEKNDFKAIIDFAHTEDALAKTLTAVRPYTKGRLILVFGVYADLSENGRDKRNDMGRVAAEYADYSIATLDNPKHHDPQIIMKEVEQALLANNGAFEIVMDRELAIQNAVEMSDEHDTIVIAGKGHETAQVIGDVAIPFNEKEIVKKAAEKKFTLSSTN